MNCWILTGTRKKRWIILRLQGIIFSPVFGKPWGKKNPQLFKFVLHFSRRNFYFSHITLEITFITSGLVSSSIYSTENLCGLTMVKLWLAFKYLQWTVTLPCLEILDAEVCNKTFWKKGKNKYYKEGTTCLSLERTRAVLMIQSSTYFKNKQQLWLRSHLCSDSYLPPSLHCQSLRLSSKV